METKMQSPPAVPAPAGFGFDAIMAKPDYGRFRRWYEAESLLPPGRAAVEDVLSTPEDDEAAFQQAA